MRFERQPNLQLRELLNVCWEGQKREGKRWSGKGDKRVERSQVEGGSEQRLAVVWQIWQTNRGRNRGMCVWVHQSAKIEETTVKWRKAEKTVTFFLNVECLMCEIQPEGRIFVFPSATSAVFLSSLEVGKGKVQDRNTFRLPFHLSAVFHQYPWEPRGFDQSFGKMFQVGWLRCSVCFHVAIKNGGCVFGVHRRGGPWCCLWSLSALPELQTAHQTARSVSKVRLP